MTQCSRCGIVYHVPCATSSDPVCDRCCGRDENIQPLTELNPDRTCPGCGKLFYLVPNCLSEYGLCKECEGEEPTEWEEDLNDLVDDLTYEEHSPKRQRTQGDTRLTAEQQALIDRLPPCDKNIIAEPSVERIEVGEDGEERTCPLGEEFMQMVRNMCAANEGTAQEVMNVLTKAAERARSKAQGRCDVVELNDDDAMDLLGALQKGQGA